MCGPPENSSSALGARSARDRLTPRRIPSIPSWTSPNAPENVEKLRLSPSGCGSTSVNSARPPASSCTGPVPYRSEEHTSELQPRMRNAYAVFCLKVKKESTDNQRETKKEHLTW